MAIWELLTRRIAILSLACTDGCYPSSAGSIQLRSASSGRSTTSWASAPKAAPTCAPGSTMDDGASGIPFPQERPAAASDTFLPVEVPTCTKLQLGPFMGSSSRHFRFTASGETVARLEERLGYVHKGIEQLMVGARTDTRTPSPDGSRATALSATRWLLRAAEAATGAAVTQRAQALRAVMAELERLANHLGDRRRLQRRRLPADADTWPLCVSGF